MDSNTAWMLIASCLVFLMIPGLAFFYGGLVRAKNVLNMIMLSLGSMIVTGLVWVLWGWSIAFGGGNGAGIVGNPFTGFLLRNIVVAKDGQFVSLEAKNALYPACVNVIFQCAIAMLAVAIISGAIAERVKFSTWIVFVGFWITFVYAPLAHMDWNTNGLLAPDGMLSQAIGIPACDNAGGALLGVGSAISALMVVMIIGRRRGFQITPMKPHNLTLTMLGIFLLLIGSFGLTGGSALRVNAAPSYAILVTILCVSASSFAWLLVEHFKYGHFTALGAASGMVAGLIAVLPGVTTLSPLWALITGLLAGGIACFAVSLKYRLGYDDSLDVIATNGVGGIVGLLAVGLFSQGNGLLCGGGIRLLLIELLVIIFVIVFAGVITGLIAFALEKTIGWRVSENEELLGIDVMDHGERAYDFEDAMNSVIKGAK